jgi:hypothetical protein
VLDHKAWTVKWEWVIWSDECYIVLGAHPRVVWVMHSDGKEFDNDCTVPYSKQTNRCVMVWGCIAWDSKGPLVVLEYPGGPGGGMDAAQYQEQVCWWLAWHNIPVLSHPTNSLDVNAIEGLWHMLKMKICTRPHLLTTIEELQMATHKAWAEITIDEINAHIDSMQKHVQAVKRAKGGHTKY